MLDVGDHQADPVAAVTRALRAAAAQEGDVAIESTKEYCELISRMQRQWLDGTVLGTYESMSALRTSMTPDAKLAGLAGRAVAAGGEDRQDASGQESLDFTRRQPRRVERISARLHDRATEGRPATDRARQLAEAANMWGVYVGEVIRRHYGGQWSTADGRHPQSLLSGEAPQPIAKARKRIVDGADRQHPRTTSARSLKRCGLDDRGQALATTRLEVVAALGHQHDAALADLVREIDQRLRQPAESFGRHPQLARADPCSCASKPAEIISRSGLKARTAGIDLLRVLPSRSRRLSRRHRAEC